MELDDDLLSPPHAIRRDERSIQLEGRIQLGMGYARSDHEPDEQLLQCSLRDPYWPAAGLGR